MLKKLGNYIRNQVSDTYTLKMAAYLIAVIIFIGSAVLFSSYYTSVKKIENISLNLSEMKLKEIRNIVDSYFRQMDSMAISLSIDKDVYSLSGMNYMELEDRLKRVLSMSNRLNNLKNSNEMLHSIYVYYKNPAAVIYDTIYKSSEIEDLKYVKEDEISTIGVNIIRNQGTTINMYKDGNPTDVLKIVRKLYTGIEAGYVVVNIDAGAVNELIRNMKLLNEEQIFVLDKDGVPILATSENEGLVSAYKKDQKSLIEINSKKYIMVNEISGYTGWSYVSMVPLESIYENYRSINLFMKTLFAIMILVGCFLGLIITHKISRPINNLYYSVIGSSSGDNGKDRIKYLCKVYENIFADNEILKGIVEKNRPLLKEKLILSLLLNKENSEEDMEERLNYALIHFAYKYFVVAVVEVEMTMGEADEFEYLKAGLCRDYVEEKFSSLCVHYAVQFEPNRIAVILNYDSDRTGLRALFQQLSNMITELKVKLDTNVSIGISRENNQLLSLNRSFLEALKCLEQKFMFGKNEIIYFEHIDFSAAEGHIYPFDLEQQLINSVKSCNVQEIGNLVIQIQEFVQINTRGNVFMQRQIFVHMISNIKQEFFKLTVDGNFQMLDLYGNEKPLEVLSSMMEFTDYIQKLCLNVVGHIMERRENKNHEIVSRILDYIEQNCSRNITVEDMASAVYISIPYLYKLLKEEIDLSPVSYLSQVRIGKAAEALKNTDMQIKEIAAECGFESIQSFYRQFKKVMNCSATEYRERYDYKK